MCGPFRNLNLATVSGRLHVLSRIVLLVCLPHCHDTTFFLEGIRKTSQTVPCQNLGLRLKENSYQEPNKNILSSYFETEFHKAGLEPTILLPQALRVQRLQMCSPIPRACWLSKINLGGLHYTFSWLKSFWTTCVHSNLQVNLVILIKGLLSLFTHVLFTDF